MVELPLGFTERMKKNLGKDYQSFIKSYETPPVKGIRVNTLKISAEEFERLAPFPLEGKIPWADGGYYASGDKLGKTVYHAAGLYYVQEPSAMSVAPKLEVKAGERVLDLCSAPGGKGTQLAQAMRGEGVLVLNEIDFKRWCILKSNVERMGVKNATVTNCAPERLAETFENYFDKILVDAPCSGEGMFKKEENAIPEWSLQAVKRCAERQTKILDCADKMLAVNGRMVYSTCTFAPEEDEEQIENFLKTHPNYILKEMKKLFPHEVKGEGHFYAVLEKQTGERKEIKARKFNPRDNSDLRLYREWEEQTLNIRLQNLYCGCRKVYYYFDGAPELDKCGLLLGERSFDEKRFEPSHTLAMCLKAGEAKSIAVDESMALNYLRGLTFDCDKNEKGWRLVTYNGYPLGWCKAVNGTAKNHLPKGLRI